MEDSPERPITMSIHAAASRPSPQVVATHFPDLLAGFRRRFDDTLAAWLGDKRRQIRDLAPEAEELAEGVAGLVGSGGKRLRPALVYFSYRSLYGREEKAVLDLAMATEVLHAYLLIHDDIMDHAELRRGAPAAHAKFRERHRERRWGGDSVDFGRAAAILMGDLAHGWAQELLLAALAADESGRGDRPALERAFVAMGDEVIAGQYLEMTLPWRSGVTRDDLLRALRLKSGRYSVERPIELGALLAGAPAETRRTLGRYGRAVGDAFQLQDDVLGTFGDPDKVGKPVGSDLMEGKRTFLVHHALEHASPVAAERLRSLLGRADLGASEVAEAQEILRASGALDAVTAMIEERSETARAAIAELEMGPEGRVFLGGLVDYLKERQL